MASPFEYTGSRVVALDWSVETLSLEYSSTGLCIHFEKKQCSEKNMTQVWFHYLYKYWFLEYVTTYNR